MQNNEAGTHNTGLYSLGRGIIYYAESLDATTKLPTDGWVDLGNATEFSISMDLEELEHKSSRTGLAITDVKIIISQELNLSFTLDSISNLAMKIFTSGTERSYTNVIRTLSIIGSGNVTIVDPTTNGGRWYDLIHPINTEKTYQTGAITISGMTEPDDFISDQVNGRIFVPAGSNMSAGAINVDVVSNASAEPTIYVVQGLAQLPPKGALKFLSENPNDNGRATEYLFKQVQLKGSGDVALLGDEWTTLGVEATAEENSGTGYTSDASKVLDIYSAGTA